MASRLGEVPGIVDVNTTFDSGKPQVDVIIDRDKAADLGISVKDLGSAIQALIGGRKATTYEEAGETYDVRVRLAETDRNRTADILEVPIRTRSDKLVELKHLTRLRSLRLSAARISDDGLSFLSALSELESLDLNYNGSTLTNIGTAVGWTSR